MKKVCPFLCSPSLSIASRVQILKPALAELPSSGYHHSRFLPQRGIPQFFRSIGTESTATPLQRRQSFIEERMASHSREGLPLKDSKISTQQGEALVEMRDVCVKYGDKPALGGWCQEVDGHTREGLWWTVRRGERWGVFGPNGKSLTAIRYYIRLIDFRVWQDDTAIPNLLGSPTSILITNKGIRPKPPPTARTARHLYFRHPS